MNALGFLYLLQGEASQGSPYSLLFLIGGMIVIMYLVMFRPQMKEQKRRREMLATLKKHDTVLTSGGIYGVVVSVGEHDLVLKIDDSSNVRVKFARSAVTAVISKGSDDTSG